MKKGNCFYVALQMIYDANQHEGPIPEILEYKNINKDDFDILRDIRLVHGLVSENGQEYIKHAWTELGDYVIDFSNGHQLCVPQSDYYKRFYILDPRRFSRNEVAQNMTDDPSSIEWWGDRPNHIQSHLTDREYSSNDIIWDRNFLEEYENLEID